MPASTLIRFVALLASCLGLISAATADDDRVVMRRLNRVEYEHTVRDLLGISVELRELLPMDSSQDGFDNVGEALHTSSFLIEKYLEAAEKALDVAIANGPRPAIIRQRYSLKDTHQVRSTSERVFRKSADHDPVVMFSSSAWQAVSLTPFYPPDRGEYRFKIKAQAIQSGGKPVTYRVDAGLMLMTGKPHLVGYFDAEADAPSLAEFTDSLEPRNTIRILPYGLAAAQEVNKIGAESYPGAGLSIEWIEVEGPLHDEWPPTSHRRIFGDLAQQPAPRYGQRNRVEVISTDPSNDAREILSRFARRAFRRPVTDDELIPYVELMLSGLADGQSFEHAVRTGLLAIMVSPDFLFLHEPPGRLDPFAIANRLSYFLWSTMPDDELMRAAETGRLTEPGILRNHVERMLNDPRSQRFHENFVGQWLGLRDIDFTRPNHLLYPEFDDMLKVSMVREAELFFAEMLKDDLSITHVVSSNFGMLNERLAQHYGIEGVDGWEFRRVELPPGSHRGGFLTMAGVLKVTANGTYTSPVTRGAWVLDRILGLPPEPPPEAVDGLVPDTRGSTTIREQLARHRSIDSCSECHIDIDPPGFALESFDVIGGWRDRYRIAGWRRDAEQAVVNGTPMRYYLGDPVDSSDKLADGRSFSGIDEFRQLLLSDKDQLARALIVRLATYATGATPSRDHVDDIENILARSREADHGLRSLVHAIVVSGLFQTK